MVPTWTCSADRLVVAPSIQTRLAQAAAQRDRDIRTLNGVLHNPRAASVTAAMGTNIERVQASVSTLNDRELRDIAARAAALQSDPRAGYYEYDPVVHDLLVVGLIVVIVLLVVEAARV